MAEDEISENENAKRPLSRRGALAAAGVILAGGVVAGAIVTGTSGASAATNPTTAEGSGSPGYGRSSSGAEGPSGESAPARGDEKAVTAEQSAKLKAAALVAVPGGTVDRIETDAGDATYEAHMTKSDGTRVTVKFDANYVVTAVEDGMGKGDPQDGSGPGAHGGGRPEGRGPGSGSDPEGGSSESSTGT
jgi:hypothetical protein